MTDFIALALFLVTLALLLAFAAGGIVPWIRNEIALMRADTWQGDRLINPALGSFADPRVALVDMKRKQLGKRMKKQGRSLISKRNAKNYVPELTKPADPPAPPPKADKVVTPLRRVA